MITAGATVVLCCLLGASVAGYTLVKYGSIERVEELGDLASAPAGAPENYLVVAVDTRSGQESRNTDTIMVLRVDPGSNRVALTSFSRDLMVTIADTGKLGMINSAFARERGGERNLTETIQQNFGISVNHYVQVDFDSFRQVVDAVGGVPLWFPYAARDRASGFYTDAHGACVNLDGEQGLAFVRSRKLDIMVDGEWQRDPLSEVNRVKRQQIFIQRALADVLSEVRSNPLRLRQMVDIGVSNVALDPNLGMGDILHLAERFKGFDPAALETYPLPTVPWPRDENRLVLDEPAAEPALNVFRGLPPGEVSPGFVTVQVLNGTVADPARQRPGLATDVSGALQEVGFEVAAPGDADTFYARTTIEHAPGQAAYAQRVVRHVTGTTPVPLAEDPSLPSGTVRLVAGADFTTVHQEPTPLDARTGPKADGTGSGAAGAGAPSRSSTATTDAPAGGGRAAGEPSTPPTTAPPRSTTTTTNPYVIGAPLDGRHC
ncbi:MAG TPA: LCP family protein [Acidimicrobiales bacterium]|nr:LCP family protein [Acidimicrobiales bacterium]